MAFRFSVTYIENSKIFNRQARNKYPRQFGGYKGKANKKVRNKPIWHNISFGRALSHSGCKNVRRVVSL